MSPASVDSVIVADFRQRPSRPAAYQQENAVLLWLVEELARTPVDIFDRLAEAVQKVCPAQSAGVSLLDEADGHFVWPAISGEWARYEGSGVARESAPCGTVLERDAPLRFREPARAFPRLEASPPAIVEAMLVPFHVKGVARGTIWALMHDQSHDFDAEDERLLSSLSRFTAAAFRTLADTGALQVAGTRAPLT